MTGFSCALSHVPFPFPDFNLRPWTVINFKCEYNGFLNPVRPSSKSSSLWMVVGSPDIEKIVGIIINAFRASVSDELHARV